LIEGGSQIFGTVAGLTRLYVLPSSIYVSIVEDDAEMEALIPKRNNLWDWKGDFNQRLPSQFIGDCRWGFQGGSM